MISIPSKNCLFFLIRIWVLVNLGIHNSPLDGSHLQIETSKEQDSREDQKIKIGEHEGLIFARNCVEIVPTLNCVLFVLIAESKLNF